MTFETNGPVCGCNILQCTILFVISHKLLGEKITLEKITLGDFSSHQQKSEINYMINWNDILTKKG